MSIVTDTLGQIIVVAKLDDITGNWTEGAGGTAIFSYGTSQDFKSLWGLDSSEGLQGIADKLYLAEGKRTIVIVWDGIPEGDTGEVITTRYLTPIDWAVAFSLSVHDKAIADKKANGKAEYPELRIIILDLNSHLVSNADGFRFLKQFPDALQWVKIVGPLQAEELIEDLRPPAKKLKSLKDGIEESDMDLIRRVWASNLTEPSAPGDHHAIANLVGPLLLLGESLIENENVKALKALVKTLKLIPEGKEEPFPWINWDDPAWSEKLKRVSGVDKLNLILIDDQYDQGWGQVLCRAVGAKYEKMDKSDTLLSIGNNSEKNIYVKAAASSEFLRRRLGDLLSERKGNGKDHLDERFKFKIDEGENNASEILLLDLRLFSGKSSVEVDFIKRLCDIAVNFVDNNDSQESHWRGVQEVKNLPWKGFSSAEIERVRKWCVSEERNKDGEDSEYIEALTFLPRIIALTDLSLPIVLFSSTGRRAITDNLKDYGNIITDFDKPKLTVDVPDDIAKQTKSKFQNAIEKALDLCHARLFVSNVRFVSPITYNHAKCSHFEVYIDESGAPEQRHFVVGGLLI